MSKNASFIMVFELSGGYVFLSRDMFLCHRLCFYATPMCIFFPPTSRPPVDIFVNMNPRLTSPMNPRPTSPTNPLSPSRSPGRALGGCFPYLGPCIWALRGFAPPRTLGTVLCTYAHYVYYVYHACYAYLLDIM